MDISPSMADYFSSLERSLGTALDHARAARSKGLDPRLTVEVPVTNDLADRVEALLGIRGVAARIRELEGRMERELLALSIADDFIARRFGETSREEVLEHAIRTAMSILTEGVVAAPTEGIARVDLGKNDSGTEYARVFYSGPIRSAGGTAQALSVLVADYVRRALAIDRYRPRPEEVERYIEEIRAYHGRVHLQYLPSDPEIRRIVENCPVCIDGEGTEDEEVSGYRNLERVGTNAIRGGMALVIAEGLALKAPKLEKHVRNLKLDGWEWLSGLTGGKGGGQEENGAKGEKYLREIIAGRPVFAHPGEKGGFRLRYGRSRNTGLAAAGLSPATMQLLGGFLAVGTQMKLERPGKAGGISPVDSLEGPTVRLANGDVMRIDDEATAIALAGKVERILDVGEILIGYGEFLENNHPLLPVGYQEEWWRGEGGGERPADELAALELALAGGYLHPAYSHPWEDITPAQAGLLAGKIEATGEVRNGVLGMPLDPAAKAVLEELLVPHQVREGRILIDRPLVLLACLGLTVGLKRQPAWETAPNTGSGLDLARHLAGFRMRPRAGTRIGGRMGRPGKSRPREMSPPPHSLFPLGDAGGSRRSFQEAKSAKTMVKKAGGFSQTEGMIEIFAGERRCPKCGKTSFRNLCECGTPTAPVFRCPRCQREAPDRCPACGVPTTSGQKVPVDLRAEYAAALERLGIRESQVALVKGVKGLISRERAVEPVDKGILRSLHDLFVFKDGTIRYDMIDLPLTHFRPDEAGVSVDRLRALGYTHDTLGNELTEPSQVLELRPQDILVSGDCAGYLVKVAGFIDELLEKVYGLPPFYQVSEPAGLIGHLLVGLAPHTSAGVLARLVGFTRANVGYAHPFFHAAKRRNCFHGDTEIEVYDGEKWQKARIRDFVTENFDLTRPGLDRLGTYHSEARQLAYVRAVDTAGTVRLRRITSVSVHRAPDALIRFETERGKSVAVTPDHAMLVLDLAYVRKIRAMELSEGDSVPVSAGGAVISERIAKREIVPSPDERVYCLTVDRDHTLEANGIFTGQCDGDEDCVMLLLDCLLNFSRAFLPESRGGTMDAPLMITGRIDPAEIDKESHNVDVCPRYPVELYLAAERHAHPREVEALVDRVGKRLRTPGQFEGFSYTHETSDISAGPLESAYTTLETMQEKLDAMLGLARAIRAVRPDDVAERVLHTHFIPDLQGNLRAFSNQTVRCTKCNAKYRRVPLAGKCPRCGGGILPTVHEASVKKYLEISRRICSEYAVSPYTRQRIEVLARAIESTFGVEGEKQRALADFM
ncbi:MAG TPA: DNA polymerase II large subunit [Methanomicrobiales archaeon]|nr:DNA polymerase II large subunit [Methanomicrobiales archaeon]